MKNFTLQQLADLGEAGENEKAADLLNPVLERVKQATGAVDIEQFDDVTFHCFLKVGDPLNHPPVKVRFQPDNTLEAVEVWLIEECNYAFNREYAY
ncbi:hypothetical protein [Larkinella soli]|uniref:hypothetical protein n=1 Tax=Larkinella soli TaxID=1770527 RepID=UPI000FFB5B80|nr:hypothetical protein [Larkinella soli]